MPSRTMMETGLTILLLLVVITSTGFIVAGRRARGRRYRIEEMQVENEAIVAEERRLFSFLQTLGAAIARDNRESSLHRLIVEGAIRVTSSKGGAFYLYDEQHRVLVPRFCSNDTSPLIDLNEKVLAQAEANPSSLLSMLRLQAVPSDMGVLGGVFTTQKPELLGELSQDQRLHSQPNAHQQNVTVMIGPLISGDRRLGVLAVTSDTASRTFSENDFEVFTSLVEQSAFALANATAHREAQSKQQIEDELRNAGEVQRILLPQSDPPLDGWVVAGRNRAARILSGDFYDYCQPDAQHFGAAIADVCGKGLPAALIAATTRSALQAHALNELSPASVLNAVNRQVSGDIREDKFVSMIYLTAELGGSQVKLARAGHPNPFLWHKNTGEVERIDSPGLAIGIDDGAVFQRVTKDADVTMQSGDVLLLYTDGVDEALDAEGEEFGKERIQRVLAKIGPQGAKAVVDEVVEALNAFVGGKASTDDVTLIALQKL